MRRRGERGRAVDREHDVRKPLGAIAAPNGSALGSVVRAFVGLRGRSRAPERPVGTIRSCSSHVFECPWRFPIPARSCVHGTTPSDRHSGFTSSSAVRRIAATPKRQCLASVLFTAVPPLPVERRGHPELTDHSRASTSRGRVARPFPREPRVDPAESYTTMCRLRIPIVPADPRHPSMASEHTVVRCRSPAAPRAWPSSPRPRWRLRPSKGASPGAVPLAPPART